MDKKERKATQYSDRNGARIHTGDIVKFEDTCTTNELGDFYNAAVIEERAGKTTFGPLACWESVVKTEWDCNIEGDWDNPTRFFATCEVIGNIWDNPTLLQKIASKIDEEKEKDLPDDATEEKELSEDDFFRLMSQGLDLDEQDKKELRETIAELNGGRRYGDREF